MKFQNLIRSSLNESGAVTNHTYQTWGNQQITEIFSETSYRLCYKGSNLGYFTITTRWVVAKSLAINRRK